MGQLQPSCVEDVGYYRSCCGYCSSERDSSGSHGMWAHQLSVDVYQASPIACPTRPTVLPRTWVVVMPFALCSVR